MNKISYYRKQIGWRQIDLARASGLRSASRIGNYESGLREPALDDCRRIVAALVAGGAISEAAKKPVVLDDVFPPEPAIAEIRGAG